MADFKFNRDDALAAINKVNQNGIEWLYQNYPKPNGQRRTSRTGFLLHDGVTYPVKPLGRLSSEIAGWPMEDNPNTNYFRAHFDKLKFQLIETIDIEAEQAVERQRRMAEILSRPNQATFRASVFAIFGTKCAITGCGALTAVEAAHIIPVSQGGSDEPSNGLPLRADLHRLFDANHLKIDPETFEIIFAPEIEEFFVDIDRSALVSTIKSIKQVQQFQMNLRKRFGD